MKVNNILTWFFALSYNLKALSKIGSVVTLG
jgi:hypothetical protein